MTSIYEDLKQLGSATQLPQSRSAGKGRKPAVRHRLLRPIYGTRVHSLCPMTGQPDFAHLVIDYVPQVWLVESKSLKLYLGAFRNHGAFHKDCTVSIGKRLVELLDPDWLRIGGYW